MKTLIVVLSVTVLLFVLGCSKSSTAPEDDPTPALVITGIVDNVSVGMGTDGAIDITVSNGTAPYSFVWSNGAETEDITGVEAGEYTVTVTDDEGLTSEKTFTVTEPSTGSFADIDGNTYAAVKIGGRWWMAENFKGSHDKDNAAVTSYAYGDNTANVTTYGRLYEYDAAVAGAPNGWHLPTDTEVKQLEMTLGMSQSQADTDDAFRGTDQGTQLKVGGGSGFNAKIAGWWSPNSGSYMGIDGSGSNEGTGFWTSTTTGSNAWTRTIFKSGANAAKVGRYPDAKTYRLSVRYIKD